MILQPEAKEKKSLETHHHFSINITHHKKKNLLKRFKSDYEIIDDDIRRSCMDH